MLGHISVDPGLGMSQMHSYMKTFPNPLLPGYNVYVHKTLLTLLGALWVRPVVSRPS